MSITRCYLILLLVWNGVAFSGAFVVPRQQQTNKPVVVLPVPPTQAVLQVHQAARRTKCHSKTALCMWSQDDDEIGGWDNRIKCCFPYLLPLLDGDHFGHFIYERFPPLGLVNDVLLGPLVNINTNVPFFGLAFFLALTLGTRFNLEMDRTIRFNAQQAALIDIVLIIPELLSSGFEPGDVPRSLAEPASNFVWYAYTSAVLYSVISILRGKKPSDIPYLSGFAETMVGPI